MSEGHSLFVYGILVHPAILSRVLTGSLKRPSSEDSSYTRNHEITVVPAILPGYTVRRVLGQEYPALVAIEPSEAEAADPLPTARGLVVNGLTRDEIAMLDSFEGDEYVHEQLQALVPEAEKPVTNAERSTWPAATLQSILDHSLPPARVQALLASTEPAAQVKAGAYVWAAGESALEDARKGPRAPWNFADFAQNHSKRWTSGQWTDVGGPDGLSTDETETPGTDGAPLDDSSGARPGLSGFAEVQRSLSYDAAQSAASFNEPSFATLSIGADPWADPPAGANANQHNSRGSENPWLTNGGTAEDANVNSDGLQDGSSRVSNVADQLPSGPVSANIDRIRPPPGFPLELEGQEAPGFERFGKPCRRLWHHGDVPIDGGRTYLNMNAGAFGTCPKPVMEVFHSLAIKAEEHVDQFRRRTAPEGFQRIRKRLAQRFNVPANTLSLIKNSTTGTNAVLRGIEWQKGDYIVCFGTVYGALDKTIDYIADAHPHKPTKVHIDVIYPATHDEVVSLFKSKLESLKAEGHHVRLATFDAITSQPGVVVPWERLVAVCREAGVLSLVDGAHAMGQVPIDLGAVRPDFFVTNAHKWNFAHRGCAVFYVSLENQHLVPTSVPTSWGYRTKAQRLAQSEAEPGLDFVYNWTDPGTDDFTSFLTLDAAMTFQSERLGGEERVRKYNRSLALLGGHRVSQILGTEVLETSPEPTLTASMVNVRLPLATRTIGTDPVEWLRGSGGGEQFFFDTLTDDFATNVPVLVHNKAIYARLSAQVWLDLDDFEYAGRALKEVCRRVEAGECKERQQQQRKEPPNNSTTTDKADASQTEG
ncbi:unnamed protein product [Parajaminaea phylloscopi]